MKWAYLFLGVFAAFFAVLFTVDGSPEDPPDALRVCITASVVNLGIFFVMHYAQKRSKKPIQSATDQRP
jgi:uncharacterized ion transporter superfamily protein YfcC